MSEGISPAAETDDGVRGYEAGGEASWLQGKSQMLDEVETRTYVCMLNLQLVSAGCISFSRSISSWS